MKLDHLIKIAKFYRDKAKEYYISLYIYYMTLLETIDIERAKRDVDENHCMPTRFYLK